MDPQLITNIFQHTLEPSPEARAEAEARLTQLSTSPGFLPVLIQLVMSEDIQIAIRQAAVIYLKNMISRYWRELEGEAGAQNFTIPETDKLFIRQHIVESIISASELISKNINHSYRDRCGKVQLTVSIHEILSCDFPEKWPDICVKINGYLTSDNKSTWLGSMLVLYQIVKKYEFKRKEDRGPIEDVMNVFLPILHNRCSSLVKDNSSESFLLITKVFKIFRALIQLNLPLRVINQDNFPQWMGLFKAVLEKPVPEESLQWEEDDRPQLSWWKAKKWAVTVLFKVFERYGCPGSEEKEYNQFADFYDKHYSEQVTGIMLKILDQYRQKKYIAPRVLQQALNYLSQGVYNARSWKIVKPHFLEIFKEIIFPLMCHSEEDESLWLDDPQEYIRIKYDIFEDFLYFSPNAAAKSYLKEAVKKRKNVLQPVVEHTMVVFNMDATQRDPKHKDGALHVIGSLAETLSKKKQYKNHMESVLTSHVLPEFLSQHGFLRARACWVTQQFAIITFKDANVLKQTLHCVLNCLGDKELPVQVEAGIAIRHIVEEQDEQGASEMIRPHVKELVQQILRVLRESENDELTGTISKLVQNFTDEVTSISLELVSTLTETFHSLVESEEDYDNKSVTAMGILETIEIIVGEVDSSPQIMAQLEQLVSRLIKSVLEKELMEYYEEVFSLINECTTIQISPLMWNMLFLLYETFQEDTADYFTEMMPCLHNYVTVDPKAFLAEQRFCEVIVKMCKTMLMDYTGENAQSQAAKLMEVVALQYRGEIDNWLPIFVSLCLERLSMEVKTSELRVMLIQVIVACIINHPIVVLTHLEKMQSPSTPQGVTARFLSQWLNDTDCFLGIHDRKVFVFGICALVSLPAETRPDAVNMFAAQFLPALLIIFEGLKTVYEKMEKDVIEEDTKPEEEELEDSDDEYDEEGTQYLESLQKKQARLHDFIDDDDWGSELEIFTTPIDDNPYVDEYITFKEAFEALQHNDARMFAMMTQTLTEEQKHAVQSVINNGIRNQQKLASRKIEEQGGYTFQAPTVPNNFSFGGSLS